MKNLQELPCNFVLFAVCSLLFSGFTGCALKKELMPEEALAMRLGSIQAVGIAAADPGIRDPVKRKKSSYAKARKMAEQELRNIVMGLTLADGQLVREIISKDKQLEKKLEKTIKKAENTEVLCIREGGCIVRVQTKKVFLKKRRG